MRLLRLLLTGAKSGGRFLCPVGGLLLALPIHGSSQAPRWERPAAEIAHRVADILGPASARLAVRNLSRIPDDAVPAIRRLLEEDLKADGVSLANADAANTIRVTLSENTRRGLWVAEVAEGNETQVVMVDVDLAPAPGPPATTKVVLHREAVVKASQLQWKNSGAREESIPEILAVSATNHGLVVLTSEQIAIFKISAAGWSEQDHFELGGPRARSRDPRGILVAAADGAGFSAFAPGVACSATFAPGLSETQSGNWTVHCNSSDDPWPLTKTGPDSWIKGFYNSRRNYFTGVVTPAAGVDLPPFYASSILPGRPGGAALLIGGMDGKVALAENGDLKPLAGARDWGSDFLVVSSGCGAGAQVIVSSSGEGAGDSLRAYEVAVQEAAAVSEPLSLVGTAMALWAAPDGKSGMAVVRKPFEDGKRFDYEVDRVTASCN